MFIRRVAAAFTAWAFAMCVWATLSHLGGVPGPATVSTATLEGFARIVERVDPPGSLGVPRLAAEQLRRTAHTTGRINGGIERAVGAWLDRLGHDAAHRRAPVAGADHARITIRTDGRSNVVVSKGAAVDIAGLGALGLRARQAEVSSLRAAQARSALSALEEAEIRLELGAGLDRDKLRERLEKLLDLLEDLQEFEGGR